MTATKDNALFIQAHPEIAKRYEKEGLDWLNVYTDYENTRIKERWERNKDGVLVDVSERERAREELARATEELEKLRRLEK